MLGNLNILSDNWNMAIMFEYIALAEEDQDFLYKAETTRLPAQKEFKRRKLVQEIDQLFSELWMVQHLDVTLQVMPDMPKREEVLDYVQRMKDLHIPAIKLRLSELVTLFEGH